VCVNLYDRVWVCEKDCRGACVSVGFCVCVCVCVCVFVYLYDRIWVSERICIVACIVCVSVFEFGFVCVFLCE